MSLPTNTPRVIDVSVHKCPLTWVYTAVALDQIQMGEELHILLGPGSMLRNIPKNCDDAGHDVLELLPLDNDRWLLRVQKNQ